jgi:signal transduction histidine kinase
MHAPVDLTDLTAQRTAELFYAEEDANHRRTDRMFAWLMAVQWLAGIGAALWISPRAWEGEFSSTHIHVWAALLLGGVIAGFPIILALVHPGAALTRHVVALGQMLTSALLIHLTGGRIETHFHVFGSLAFLAFYRDWRVLVTATMVVAADHFVRGAFWPQSVFGVLATSPWRWLEHAGWVLFEDVFLFQAIRQNLRTMFGLAERQAELETVNASIERQVAERTRELRQENAERKRAEAELIEAHRELLVTSRVAGMAEIATNVIHNVGNVLNSVNVSAGVVADTVRKSRVESLARVVALLKEHEHDLGEFITNDPKGRQLPAFLAQLSEYFLTGQKTTLAELDSLQLNIGHIRDIVAMQQNYAKVSGLEEIVNVVDLVEDSLRMNDNELARHRIEIVREFGDVPPINVDKHKVLQILINLIRNARYACEESERADGRLTLRVSNGDGRVKVSVIDNGVGIPQENLTRIFNHGFTTRKGGHGFGLHSSALAAKEIGGSLCAQSDGPDRGATFTLELPLQSAKSLP